MGAFKTSATFAVGDEGTKHSQFNQFNSETWSANESEWTVADLARSQIIRSTYHADPSLRGKTGDVHAIIHSSLKFTYPNFASYWMQVRTQDFPPNDKGWIIRYDLKPRFWPDDASEADPLVQPGRWASTLYLQETKLVQVTVPEVQAVIHKLDSKRGLNRLQMAREIQILVQQTLQVDNFAAGEALITILDTKSILERRKGVCQHYANLFAAIARGLGLPTKMIVGQHLSDETYFGGHAWNEIETRPGVWRPIEPQAKSLAFNSTEYVPLIEGYMLESRKVDQHFADTVDLI